MRKILLTTLLNVGCGSITVKGGTKNTVEGETTQRIVLEIPACSELPQEERLDCIRAFIELAKSISDTAKTCTVNEDGTLNSSAECEALIKAIKQN